MARAMSSGAKGVHTKHAVESPLGPASRANGDSTAVQSVGFITLQQERDKKGFLPLQRRVFLFQLRVFLLLHRVGIIQRVVYVLLDLLMWWR